MSSLDMVPNFLSNHSFQYRRIFVQIIVHVFNTITLKVVHGQNGHQCQIGNQ